MKEKFKLGILECRCGEVFEGYAKTVWEFYPYRSKFVSRKACPKCHKKDDIWIIRA